MDMDGGRLLDVTDQSIVQLLAAAEGDTVLARIVVALVQAMVDGEDAITAFSSFID